MDKVDRGRLDIHIMRRMDEEYARMDHVDAIATIVIVLATITAFFATLLLAGAVAAAMHFAIEKTTGLNRVWISCIVAPIIFTSYILIAKRYFSLEGWFALLDPPYDLVVKLFRKD